MTHITSSGLFCFNKLYYLQSRDQPGVTSLNAREAQSIWQAASGVMGGGGTALGVKPAQGVHASVCCERVGLVAGDGVVE